MLHFLLFFRLTTLSLHLPKSLTSDWLYITRVTGVFSDSFKLLCPQSLVTVSSVIIFTVDPLSCRDFSFPLTSWVAKTQVGRPLQANALTSSFTSISTTYSYSSLLPQFLQEVHPLVSTIENIPLIGLIALPTAVFFHLLWDHYQIFSLVFDLKFHSINNT